MDAEKDIRVSDSEFPSGGARVAARRDPEVAQTLNKDVRSSYTATRTTVGAPQRLPEQVSLNLEEAVPMLMDSVEEKARATEAPDDSVVEDGSYEVSSNPEPSLGDMQELDELEKVQEQAPERQHKPAQHKAPQNSREKNKSQGKNEDLDSGPSEVLIVNIMARAGETFPGQLLLDSLVEENLKFGDMDIFHRHEDEDGNGSVLFSVANMIVPGTFSLAEMTSFSTRGISMFMQLPVSGESLQAFDIMAKSAKTICAKLDGELKDENRSVMTGQTFEHYRQRVLEFERQRKLKNA